MGMGNVGKMLITCIIVIKPVVIVVKLAVDFINPVILIVKDIKLIMIVRELRT